MIRARLKTVEQIDPEWFHYFPRNELFQWFARDGGTELELSDAVVLVTATCRTCHCEMQKIPCRRILGKSLRGCNLMPTIFVDLDEGKS